MLINWFTVIAQSINFLILVWLLKRFLYKPILKAIDDRENRIAAQIADAERKDAAAKTEKEEFEKKNAAFDKERNDLMKHAIEETKTEKFRLLAEVKAEASALREKLENTLMEDQKNAGTEIAIKTKREVFAIARKTLEDLADADLEEKIVYVFIKRLQQLEAPEKEALIAAFKRVDKAVLVRSTMELSEAQQKAIKETFNKELQLTANFQFETSPDLISGIEMNANGYKVAWSISEYLAAVEKSIAAALKAKWVTTDKGEEGHHAGG